MTQAVVTGDKPPRQFKAALAQMRVEGGAMPRNLERAEARIAEAAAHGADLVLLPETMDLGWTHPSSLTQAEPIPGGVPFSRLAAAAQEHAVYVCAGLTERDSEKVYNAAVLLDREGHLLLKYRKLNELDIGHKFYGQGDRLKVAQTEFGRIGVLICADAFAKGRVLSRSLGYMGADVILSPSAWAVPANHDNTESPYGGIWRHSYCPVAEEFSVWFLSVSSVGPMTAGPWQGRNCIGCSMTVDVSGKEILQGPYGVDADTILYVDVSPVPRPARGTQWETHRKQQD